MSASSLGRLFLFVALQVGLALSWLSRVEAGHAYYAHEGRLVVSIFRCAFYLTRAWWCVTTDRVWGQRRRWSSALLIYRTPGNISWGAGRGPLFLVTDGRFSSLGGVEAGAPRAFSTYVQGGLLWYVGVTSCRSVAGGNLPGKGRRIVFGVRLALVGALRLGLL